MIARELRGSVDEVVISFAQLYDKTVRNLDKAAKEGNFTWKDPSDEWKRGLAAELAATVREFGMQLRVCSQASYVGAGCAEARCVDADRLATIRGRPLSVPEKGNRPECACHQARDIGDYDTCPHGCAYCYAVRDQGLARARYSQHDPESETLFPVPPTAEEDRQANLF
jgi:hypothetical protein